MNTGFHVSVLHLAFRLLGFQGSSLQAGAWDSGLGMCIYTLYIYTCKRSIPPTVIAPKYGVNRSSTYLQQSFVVPGSAQLT